MPSNSISETGVVFFSAGGHSHDGGNSSVIDTRSYSIFDFNFGRLYTTRTRARIQDKNEVALRDYIVSVVNSAVLDPAGIVLQDNIINSRNIIAGSITSEEIAANTITANNIAANTITGDLIQGNTILGSSILAGSITATQIAAGTLVTDQLILTNGDFWSNTGSFRLGGVSGITYSGSGSVNIGSNVTITGSITSTGTISGGNIIGSGIDGSTITGTSVTASFLSANNGSVGGWVLGTTFLIAGSTILYSNGTINANLFRTASANARIEMGPGAGTVDEIFFYDSTGTTPNRATVRNPGGGVLRISAGAGGTYTFGASLSTAAAISCGVLTSTSLGTGGIQSTSISTGALGASTGSFSGAVSATDYTTAGRFNGVFLSVTAEAHSRVQTTLGGSMVKVLNSADGVQIRNGFDNADRAIRATAFNASSSIHLKKDIEPFEEILDLLINTNVYKWRYIDDVKNETHIFPVAEDLSSYLLNTESTGESVVDIRDAVGFLWKGIQELFVRFDERIEKIEQAIEEM